MAERRAGEIQPVYLTLGHVLELYGLIMGTTAVEARDQLRNRPGIESAIARPETHAHYEDADLALQAAVLAHGIAESQCFIDGNKRIALIAMLTFLEINGWRIEASDRVLADWILSFSSGASPQEVAALIRSAMRSLG